jgi:hypothetical protein
MHVQLIRIARGGKVTSTWAMPTSEALRAARGK